MPRKIRAEEEAFDTFRNTALQIARAGDRRGVRCLQEHCSAAPPYRRSRFEEHYGKPRAEAHTPRRALRSDFVEPSGAGKIVTFNAKMNQT